MRIAWLGAAALVLAVGCYDLPTIERGVCGNGVLEPGEDCDGFAPDGAACAGPDDPARACFVTCEVTGPLAPDDFDTGAGTGCPDGWGCGHDGVCRRPTGTFTHRASAGSFLVDQFAIGDVDGDEFPDVIGNDRSEIAVRFGDVEATYDTSVTTPIRVPRGPLTYGRFDGDALLDAIVPTEEGVVVLRGSESRALQPVPFAPFRVESLQAEMVALDVLPGAGTQIVAIFTAASSAAMGYLGSPADAFVPLPGDPALLVRPVPVADLDGALGERDEMVVAFVGDPVVRVFETTGIGTPGNPLVLGEATSVTMPRPVRGGVIVADVDGDGDGDLLADLEPATATPELHVAFNTGGTFAAPVAAPGFQRLAFDGSVVPLELGLPLAAGDLDGDGRDDYVFGGVIALALGDDGGRPTTLALQAIPPSNTLWVDAVIADLNADGRNDVATASSQLTGLDFYIGTGGLPNRVHIDADRPARLGRSLATGDFDGDLVVDVAFIMDALPPFARDTAAVAFGSRAGAFGPAVEMAQFDRLAQLAPALVVTTASLDSVFDLLALTLNGGDEAESLEVALLFGDSSRRMIAPFVLDAGAGEAARVPESVLLGDFNLDGLNDLFAIARVDDSFGGSADGGRSEAWFLPGEPSGLIDTAAVQSGALSSYEQFDAACSAWVVGDLDGSDRAYGELVGLDHMASCNGIANEELRAPSLVMIRVATDAGVDLESARVAIGDGSLRGPETLELADLDGDGDLDALILFRGDHLASSDPATPIPGAGVAVLWNGGGAMPLDYASPDVLPAIAGGRMDYRTVKPIELNGDGWLDLVVTTDGGAYRTIYDPDKPGFGELENLDAFDARTFEVGDLNQDGLLDFAYVSGTVLVIALQLPEAPLGDGATGGDVAVGGAR